MTQETLQRAKQIETEIQDCEQALYSLTRLEMSICEKSKKTKNEYRLCTAFFDEILDEGSIGYVLPKECNAVLIDYFKTHIEKLKKELEEL